MSGFNSDWKYRFSFMKVLPSVLGCNLQRRILCRWKLYVGEKSTISHGYFCAQTFFINIRSYPRNPLWKMSCIKSLNASPYRVNSMIFWKTRIKLFFISSLGFRTYPIRLGPNIWVKYMFSHFTLFRVFPKIFFRCFHSCNVCLGIFHHSKGH